MGRSALHLPALRFEAAALSRDVERVRLQPGMTQESAMRKCAPVVAAFPETRGEDSKGRRRTLSKSGRGGAELPALRRRSGRNRVLEILPFGAHLG